MSVSLSTPNTAVPILSEHHVFVLACGIVAVLGLAIIQPWILSRAYKRYPKVADPASSARTTSDQPAPASFFQIPYITWFLMHFGVAALVIMAVVLLAVDNVLDKGTVSALLGSLLGYVLGSAATSRGAQQPSNQPLTSRQQGGTGPGPTVGQ
jgi:hypothetical protein